MSAGSSGRITILGDALGTIDVRYRLNKVQVDHRPRLACHDAAGESVFSVDANTNGFDGIRLWIFGHEGEGTAPVSAGVMLARKQYADGPMARLRRAVWRRLAYWVCASCAITNIGVRSDCQPRKLSAVLGNECGNPTHDPEVDRKAVPARSVSLHPGQIGATTNTRRARSTTRHRLGLGDRLHRRARALVLLSHRKRIDERALLAEAKHVSRLAKASAYRFGIDPVELPVTHVRVGVCDDRLQGCPRGLARSATRSRTPCRTGWGRSAVRSRSKVDPDGSVDRPLRTAAVSASTMSFRSPGLPSSCIERCTSNTA